MILVGIFALAYFGIDDAKAQCVITINGTNFTDGKLPPPMSYYKTQFPITYIVDMGAAVCKFKIDMSLYVSGTNITATNGNDVKYVYNSGKEDKSKASNANVNITLVQGSKMGGYQNLTLNVDVLKQAPTTIVVRV
ncbi:unnamed protein product [Gordionus sp. m RMFG-2023]|uniref:uncharacterized protein LOC135925969 n=1 Tax=Gordionus sp. m RMFG-2023 TaxID=3053472 RepID=UPI0030DFC445